MFRSFKSRPSSALLIVNRLLKKVLESNVEDNAAESTLSVMRVQVHHYVFSYSNIGLIFQSIVKTGLVSVCLCVIQTGNLTHTDIPSHHSALRQQSLSTHLETMKRVCFGEHLELGQLPDESDRFILCLDVDLVLLPNLQHRHK